MLRGTRVVAGIVCACALAVTTTAQAAVQCTAAASAPTRVDTEIAGAPTYAYVSLPESAPRALITYDHGYGDLPGGSDERRNIELLSRRLQSIVVAPVYRGTREIDAERSAGAPLRAGVADTVELARRYRAACGERIPVVAVGLSMGGTISALSAIEARFYSLWVGINPMQDSITASLASRAAGATAFADDLDAEHGGTPLTATAAYRSTSLVLRHAELARSGIRRAVIIDALGDATGAQLQTNLLAPLLRLDRLAVERHVRLLRDPDSPPEGDVFTPLLGNDSPFTGHLGLTSVRIAVERIAAFLGSTG